MALPIANRDLLARPLSNDEMLEMLDAYVEMVTEADPADPVGVRFATGLRKYFSDRPVLMRDLAAAADLRNDRLGS